MSAGIVSLTGATGFIGSVLRERLVARGVKEYPAETAWAASSRSGSADRSDRMLVGKSVLYIRSVRLPEWPRGGLSVLNERFSRALPLSVRYGGYPKPIPAAIQKAH